jgi:hypothetical protein
MPAGVVVDAVPEASSEPPAILQRRLPRSPRYHLLMQSWLTNLIRAPLRRWEVGCCGFASVVRTWPESGS